MRVSVSSSPRADAGRWFDRVLAASALTCALIFGGIVVLLAWRALPVVIGHGTALLAPSVPWQPQAGALGMLPMLGASLLVALLALAIAVPLSLLSAAWMHLFASRAAATVVRGLLELMAGIPSVVYGLWGLLVLVPFINRFAPPGVGWLASSLVLAAMIVPLSLLVADAALARFPSGQRSAAAALGISRWGLWRQLMVPHAAGAIATGTVLQLGRALGETMAVLMVAGNVVQWPGSLLAPVRTLTANIALEMAYATGEHRAALYASGLLLTALTTLLLLAVRRWQGTAA